MKCLYTVFNTKEMKEKYLIVDFIWTFTQSRFNRYLLVS